MRAISLSVFLILAVRGFSHAATFECMFSPGQEGGSTCVVNTKADLNIGSKCLEHYSNTLFGQCAGRETGSGDQLICFFANPVNPPNLGRSVIEQVGVYAVAIEWASTIGATSVQAMHFDYKDGQTPRSVDCAPSFTTTK
jgi:hypothetical protein